MNCNDIGEYLIDVAAGTPLEPPVEAHLKACAACTERLQEMRRTMALMDEWQAPEPSPYFDTRLHARLREEAARPQGWFAWLRKPALAAAMAGLVVAGAVLYQSDFKPVSRPPIVNIRPGTAVGDVYELDKNHDLFANFDLLDDLGSDGDNQTANP